MLVRLQTCLSLAYKALTIMALKAPQFIGWSRFLTEGVAHAPFRAAPHGSPVDIGSHRVIVQSSFASYRIREELAKQAPNEVLIPILQTLPAY